MSNKNYNFEFQRVTVEDHYFVPTKMVSCSYMVWLHLGILLSAVAKKELTNLFFQQRNLYSFYLKNIILLNITYEWLHKWRWFLRWRKKGSALDTKFDRFVLNKSLKFWILSTVICMVFLRGQKTDHTNGGDHTNGDHTNDGG